MISCVKSEGPPLPRVNNRGVTYTSELSKN